MRNVRGPFSGARCANLILARRGWAWASRLRGFNYATNKEFDSSSAVCSGLSPIRYRRRRTSKGRLLGSRPFGTIDTNSFPILIDAPSSKKRFGVAGPSESRTATITSLLRNPDSRASGIDSPGRTSNSSNQTLTPRCFRACANFRAQSASCCEWEMKTVGFFIAVMLLSAALAVLIAAPISAHT